MIRTLATCMNLGKRFYGNLKDSDRIFTNVYKDDDPYIKGALRRVFLKTILGRLVSN